MHIKIVKGVGLLGNSTSPTTLIILNGKRASLQNEGLLFYA